MKIKITSDSTCDLSRDLLERYNISIIPLYVIKDGQSYRDGVDIRTDDIYAHVDAGGALCTTSAVSMVDYEEFFTREVEGYDGLVHLNISKTMSSCHQNAVNAARQFGNVQVVDSCNLSTAQGLLALEGAEMAMRGNMDEKQIAEALRALTDKVDASFILDRLDYMSRGGRCSSAAALGASLLSLKPCIEVHEGKMGVAKKYRGKLNKVLRDYVRDRLENNDGITTKRIMITHTPMPEGAVELVREEVKKYQNFGEIIETEAQCTIACHCGPHTLGILYINK